MKKIETCFLSAVLTISCLLGLSACGTADPKQKTVLLNGYESYNDLLTTTAFNTFYGNISINEDEEFITEGKGSGKFVLDYGDADTYENIGDLLNAMSFGYMVSEMEAGLRYIDKIDSVCADIYNASDFEYEIYFAALAEDGSSFVCDGAVLASQAWNYLTFDIKPWFFEDNTLVYEYVFYVGSVEDSSDRTATFYMDNLRFVVNEDVSAPAPSQPPEVNFSAVELLGFNDVRDTDFVLTHTSSKTKEIQPLFYAEYDNTVSIHGSRGALRVSMDRSHLLGIVYNEYEGYNLEVLSSLLAEAKNAKTFVIDCYNPGRETQEISLIASNNAGSVSVKQKVAGGQTERIILNDVSSIGDVNGLTITIHNWKMTDRCDLYFSRLGFTL